MSGFTITYPNEAKITETYASNHAKYFEESFTMYSKLRRELLGFTKTITKYVVEDNEESKISRNQLIIMYHRFLYEIDRYEIDYKRKLQDYNSILQNSTKQNDAIEEIEKKRDELANDLIQLNEKISDITNVQKPLIEKTEAIVNKAKANLNKSRARLLHKSQLKNRLIYDESSLDIDVKSMKFKLEDVIEDELVKEFNLQEYINKNAIKSIEKLSTQDGFEDDEILFNIQKSIVKQDTNEDTTIDEYDRLINETIEEIKDLKQERTKVKSKWQAKADLIMKLKQIVDEAEDNDVEMEDA